MSATTAPHAEAARRVGLRDTLACILRDVVPGCLTTYGGGDADLFHVDACDAADELIEELAAGGYEIRRASA